MATQPQDFNNSAVSNEPLQFVVSPLAAISVVNVDHVSTVAAPQTVEPVEPKRCGAQSYDLWPRPKPTTKDAFLIIVALILLLILSASSLPISPLVEVNCNSKHTLNYWASMGSVLTFEALIVPLILALITLIRLIVNSVQKLFLKWNFASLATPSKAIIESTKAQKVCGWVEIR